MKKLILVLFLIFSGCSVKSALKQDPLYQQTLKYTKRCQIVNSLETKALIDVVYLTPLYQDKFKNQVFLIGIYNDFNNTPQNAEFTLLVNGKKAKVSNSIPQYILYKNFPFYNEWMSYYLLKTNSSKPVTIIYKSKHWGECKFIF
ncbi:MAG: hypothetical protein GXO62_08520 [Epsilonproteobacteria bacterium]|nr:hypothetical protein [Campylobacterota bacterium]